MLFSTETKNLKKITHFTAVIILSLTMAGCSSLPFFGNSSDKSDSQKVKISNDNQQKHYNRAARKLNANKFEEALEDYNEFIIEYPFGTLSERARLERIFILNNLNATEEARTSINRFIVQHPLHPNIDYAYYMRGVVLFEKKRTGALEYFGGAKEIYRNKNNYEASQQAFEELIQEYPDSRYVPDARQRIIFLRNNLAKYELSVAQFYAKRNAHIGAIKRAKFIVENFDQAPAVIDALELMVSSYEKIGLTAKADEARVLLANNYQNIEGINAKLDTKAKKPWLRLPNLNPFKRDKKEEQQKTTKTKFKAKANKETNTKKSWFRLPNLNPFKRNKKTN